MKACDHATTLVSQCWSLYVGSRGDMLGVEHIGASALAAVVLRNFGLTLDKVCKNGPRHFWHEHHNPGQGIKMTKHFKMGDHVGWNSEAGQVHGRIIKVHTRDFDYKGHTHHADTDEPQYEIKSDISDHVAAHKGAALHKVK